MIRRLQQVLFVIGLAAFVAAAVKHQDYLGETLWRVGMAGMITSLALGMAFSKKP